MEGIVRLHPLVFGLAVCVGCGHDAGAARSVAAAILAETTPGGIEVHGQVVGVHDGDTITVLDANRVQHKIRLLGIDAPELKQAFGRASKQHLSDACFGGEVRVIVRKRDRYNRELGQVFTRGRDLNLEQVRAGLAWHYKDYAGDQDPADRVVYAEAEGAARRAQRGLWGDTNPTPPWEYRKFTRSTQ